MLGLEGSEGLAEDWEPMIDPVQSLNRLIDKRFLTDYYEDPKIGSLTRDQEKKLRAEAHRLQLKLKVDRGISSIELKGNKESIAVMKHKIGEILRQIEKKAQAETMKSIVQWKRMDSNDTTVYPPEINLEIEEAYKKKQPTCTIEIATSGEHYTINFSKMEETDHKLRKKHKVIRVTTGRSNF